MSAAAEWTAECLAAVKADPARWKMGPLAQCVECGALQSWVGPEGRPVCPGCWLWEFDVEAAVQPLASRPPAAPKAPPRRRDDGPPKPTGPVMPPGWRFVRSGFCVAAEDNGTITIHLEACLCCGAERTTIMDSAETDVLVKQVRAAAYEAAEMKKEKDSCRSARPA